MKINAIENHRISIKFMGHPKETFLWSTCLELFLAQKSISKKECKCYYKRDSFFELKTGASSITKSGR